MTESNASDRQKDDEPLMPKDGNIGFRSKLSPSAMALFDTVKVLEDGGSLNVFQEDDDLKRLRNIVFTYRGRLHSRVEMRLQEVVNLGNVSIISQRDLMSLIEDLWADNVSHLSRTELPFLEAALRSPGRTLKEMAASASMTYAKARRAEKRLSSSGVLHISGMMNVEKIGLERLLVMIESPSLVLSGPYMQKALLSESYSPLALLVSTIPYRRLPDFLDAVASIRNSAESASVWRLSAGKPRFSGLYYSPENGWSIDLLHFRLMLRRGGDPLTLSDSSRETPIDSIGLRAADIRIIDALVSNFDNTANEIVDATSVSTSTAFRRRSQIIQDRLVVPRAKVQIPRLSDRVCAILSLECAGDIIHAWSCLPLSYQSRIQRIDTSGGKTVKVLLVSALPAGSANDVIRILKEEVSKVHDFSAFAVSAGINGQPKLSVLYNSRKKSWKWDGMVDAPGYSMLRRSATTSDIPVDLA